MPGPKGVERKVLWLPKESPLVVGPPFPEISRQTNSFYCATSILVKRCPFWSNTGHSGLQNGASVKLKLQNTNFSKISGEKIFQKNSV
jgi:hypothetical protein